MAAWRGRLSYANVMATLAFFVAIGGTTIAATKIDGGDIERGSIKGKSLAKRTIPGSKLKPDSIGGPQIREASLGPVPAAELAFGARDSDQVGGMTAAELTDRCPAETLAYAGACFDSAARGTATWPAAAKSCGDAGGRLPSLDELEGFRQLPGVVLGAPGSDLEHTTTFLDGDGQPLDGDGFLTAGLRDGGSISTGLAYGGSSAAFRCVFPLTNR